MITGGHLAAPPRFVRLVAHPLRWRLLTELAESDYRVREFVTRLGQPQNLVSYHLRLLREGGLVTATRSSFDGRDSYYRLALDRCADALAECGAALHPALDPALQRALDPAPHPARGVAAAAPIPAPIVSLDGRRSPRIAVLFVCTGNSARSPMAETFLRHRAGVRVSVASAGTRPKHRLHPHAVRVLREAFGIDIAGQRPRHLDTVTGVRFTHVITLCDIAREACPDFGEHPRRIHWSVPDPATAADTDPASYPAFHRTATSIDTRIRHLLPALIPTLKEAQP